MTIDKGCNVGGWGDKIVCVKLLWAAWVQGQAGRLSETGTPENWKTWRQCLAKKACSICKDLNLILNASQMTNIKYFKWHFYSRNLIYLNVYFNICIPSVINNKGYIWCSLSPSTVPWKTYRQLLLQTLRWRDYHSVWNFFHQLGKHQFSPTLLRLEFSQELEHVNPHNTAKAHASATTSIIM